MTAWVAVGAYLSVHALGVYLLRASDVWRELFGAYLQVSADATPDTLASATEDWIDNHDFWAFDDAGLVPGADVADEPPEQTDPGTDADSQFWGSAAQSDAG